jgi:hypothetical protein
MDYVALFLVGVLVGLVLGHRRPPSARLVPPVDMPRLPREPWRDLASAFVISLLLVAPTGCASAGLQIGRDSTEATDIVYVQRLVDLYGEDGAISRLVATGVKPQHAQKLVLDAQVSRGPAAKESK